MHTRDSIQTLYLSLLHTDSISKSDFAMDQNNRPLEIEVKVDALFSRTKNKNIPQSLWVFVIRKKSIQQIWKKNWYKNRTRWYKNRTASKKVIHKIVEATRDMK